MPSCDGGKIPTFLVRCALPGGAGEPRSAEATREPIRLELSCRLWLSENLTEVWKAWHSKPLGVARPAIRPGCVRQAVAAI